MSRRVLVLATALLLLLALAGSVAAQQADPPQGIAQQQYPVFRLTAPPVNADTALGKAGLLDGIGGTQVTSDTTYARTRRFVAGNPMTGAVLEQYGATGGFFAYDPKLAFTETVRSGLDPDGARLLACRFLMTNQLFPAEYTGPRDCVPGQLSLYRVITATLDTNDTSPGARRGVLGLEVQVPLAINIGLAAPMLVPLAGPGGHLSLLFTSTDGRTGNGLDSSAPGLAALAEPWFDRTHPLIGRFAAVSPQAASEVARRHIQATLPAATAVITPGTPTVTYFVGDAASPQTALVPELLFDGATALVDGNVVSIKSFTVPAVTGFLPDVTITAPAPGSKFKKGSVVNFTGNISGGAGPYTYTWRLEDGSVLDGGTTPGGTVGLSTAALPVSGRGGQPINVTVRLVVSNTYGAPIEAAVSLTPDVQFIYLPLLMRGGAAALAVAGPSGPTALYRVGVEWLKNYNGTNGNLALTQPDADGLYWGLIFYGWAPGFRWTDNSAWEKDWRDSTLGGLDAGVADSVDFAYFSGHGSATRIYFGTSHDALSFWGGNARFEKARWVGFSSCQTLRNDTIGTWFPAFRGAHMLLGFQSNMGDVDFGSRLSDNMKPYFFGLIQRSIREAWVQTAFEMNAGKPAYIYATGTNGVNPVDNKLPLGSAAPLPRPYPVSWFYWVWYN